MITKNESRKTGEEGRRVPRGRALPALLLAVLFLMSPLRLPAQHLLVPMDDDQQNHLKAYGLTYNALKAGMKGEWFLNYRGGAFLLPDTPELRRQATLDGVTVEAMDGGTLAGVRAQIAAGNMEAVPLEKAPRVAIYTPPKSPPWDDAVTLALRYAGIDYTTVYDDEVLRGDLSKYEWLHLHHEDFTGQLSKFYLAYRGAPWFVEQYQRNMEVAKRQGYSNIPSLKKAVADGVREFVQRGGFLFAMCGATETLELAMAGHDVDIAGSFSDGSPVDPNGDAKMDWARSFAFRGAHVEQSPYTNAKSDIDGHQEYVPSRRQP